MSTKEENKELVQRFVDEVLNEGKDRVKEYVAPDYVEHNSAVPHDIEGVEGVKANFEQFHAAFPDLNVTFEDLIAEDDKVVQRHRVTGTHEGELMGIEPTGNTVDISGIVINQIEDGLIVEAWVQLDMMGMMQQLGVVEPPGE